MKKGLLRLTYAVCAVAVFIGVALSSRADQPPVLAKANVIKFSRSLKTSDLDGRPDTDTIEFSGGYRMTMHNFRRIQAAARKLRGPKVNLMPAT